MFFAPIVDAILYAHARLVLGKNGCRYAEVANTPVSNRSCIAHRVEHRPTTDGHDIRMAVYAVPIYRFDDTLHTVLLLLNCFPTGNPTEFAYPFSGGFWSKVAGLPFDKR